MLRRVTRVAGWPKRPGTAVSSLDSADRSGSKLIRCPAGMVVGAVEFRSDCVLSGWVHLGFKDAFSVRTSRDCRAAPLTFVPRPDLPRSAQGFFCVFPTGLQDGDRILLSLHGRLLDQLLHLPQSATDPNEMFALHYDEPREAVARKHVRCKGWVQAPRAVGRIRFFVDGAEQTVSFHPRWDAMLALSNPTVVGFEFEFDLAAFGQDIAIDCEVDGHPTQRTMVETRVPSPPRSRDALTLFMHIPKTAGTSVANVFRRQPSLEACWLYPSERFSFPQQVAALGERADALDLIGGHFTYGLHRSFRRDCQYVTFFRRPQDLLVSYFNYVKHTARQPAWANLSLREAVTKRADWHLDNPLTRYLADVPSTRALTRDDVRTAVSHMRRRFAVVGIIDRMDESLRRLSQAMDLALGPVGTENRTPLNDPLDKNEDELEHLLRFYTAFDHELYAEAQERL